MNDHKTHIISKIASTLLVVVLLLPLGIRLQHSLEHQDYELCAKNNAPNFHECEIDCEFLKYNLQHFYTTTIIFKLNSYLKDSYSVFSLAYNFTYNYHALSVSLRGPPALV